MQYSFTINTDETTVKISRPKCKCMSCEGLNIVITDDDGTRTHYVYALPTGSFYYADLIESFIMLADQYNDTLKQQE